MSENPTNDTEQLRDDRNGAVLTGDGNYRYRLWRTWDVTKPTVAFLMLNPSTADDTDDDATIRRCIGYARRWGYGRLVVGNLYAVRETDPDNVFDNSDPVGPENERHLREIVNEAEKVVAAWGTGGGVNNRGETVARMLDTELCALDTTKDGHPVHPLYQPADAEPEQWDISSLHTATESEATGSDDTR